MPEVVMTDVRSAFRRGIPGGRLGRAIGWPLVLGGGTLAALGWGQRHHGRARWAALVAAVTGARSLLRQPRQQLHFERTVTIDEPPAEIYALLRDLASWPRFSTRIVGVDVIDQAHWRWRERVIGSRTRSWDVALTAQKQDRWIAWRGESRRLVEHGTIFVAAAPGGRGTEVRAVLEYEPLRAAARMLARPLGRSPEQVLAADLRRLKRLLETGEIIELDHPPAGERSFVGRVLRETGVTT